MIADGVAVKARQRARLSYVGVFGRNDASSAGMNTRLAISVHPRLIRSNTPMLAVPGWPDSAREPNAVPVVSAENKTALAVAEASGVVTPARQFITK